MTTLALITQLENRILEAADARTRVDALLALSQAIGRDDILRAMNLAEEAYYLCSDELFDETPYLSGLGRSLLQLGLLQNHLGDYGVALNQSYEALTLLEQAQDTAGQIEALNIIGRIYLKLGVAAEALNFHLDALELSQSSGDTHGEAHSYHRLGSTCMVSGEFEQARQHCERALALFARQKPGRAQAGVLNDLCVILTHLGLYPEAVVRGQASVAMFTAVEARTGTAVALTSVGEAYLAAEQYTAALDYFQQALTISSQVETGFYTAEGLELLRDIGLTHVRLQQYPEALDYLERALGLSQKVESRRNQYLCHQALAELYEAQQAWRLALEHYQKFHALREQDYTAEGDARTRHLQVLYQTRTAQQEAESYRREMERLEQLRTQDRQYFERLTQMQKDFLSAASHDLKNPLTGINTAMHLMRRTLSDRPEMKYVQSVERQVDRMRDLIADLLELAKLETGRALQLQEVEVNGFLEAAVDEVELLVEGREHTLETYLLPEDMAVHMDPRLLKRVVVNLLSNAIKYTPAGGQVILAAELDTHDNQLVVRVRDSGIGIPTADIPHLFERFYRVQRQDHQTVEGTGLGLAIVKTIVEQHGGRIWVESSPDQGSAFNFTIPLLPPTTLQLRQNYYTSVFTTLGD